MADKAAAERLKKALRVAMTEHNIDTWTMLGIKTRVSPTTVENWIYGRTVPRAKELRIVGEYLRPYTSPAELEAAYAGLEPPEPPLAELLRELIPELRDLVVVMRAQADQALLEEFQSALVARRRRYAERSGEPPSAPSDETADDRRDS